MEFWDALEDSQYLDAVASIRDGPKPICKWDIPTEEQLKEWEERVQSRKTSTTQRQCHPQDEQANEDDSSIEPLSFDWYVSSPIGFFFFSTFVKEQHNKASKGGSTRQSQTSTQEPASPGGEGTATAGDNNNNTNNGNIRSPPPKRTSLLEDQLAYVRMNFLEDLLRFQKVAKATSIAAEHRSKQVHQFGTQLLHYLQPPEREEETDAMIMPKMTQIREFDLHYPRCSSPRRLGVATQAEVEAALNVNHEDTYQTNLVGLKGPLLQEVTTALREWNEMNAASKIQKSESEPNMQNDETNNDNEPTNNNNNDSNGNKSEGDPSKEGDEGAADTKTSSPLPPAPAAPTNNNGKRTIRRVETAMGGSSTTSGKHPPIITTSINGGTNTLYPILQKVEVIIYESLKRDYGGAFQANSPLYCRMRNFLWFQDRRVIHEDFYIMRVLGRGGFGLVSACQKGTTGKLYAMKVMSKKRIKLKKSVQFVMNERKALASVSESPFIINLKYSLHSEDEVYLVLDLMSGGDLGFHLHQRKRFGPNQCLYYSARIMLGLQALHDKRYVYRDLKPENCLLSEDGRVKLTDLGLATKTHPYLPAGVVGTRGYWAPEMHNRDEAGKRVPYNHAVDWFSFGCCLAEFICGKNPFRSEAAYRFGVERGEKAKDKALDLAIREWEPELNPEIFQPDAADLCRRLMDKDPTSRLGARGCEEIMAHPWFKTVDWEAIITDRRKPPFIPPKDVNAASQHEIGNFADDNSRGRQDVAFDESDERVYEDWDWTNPKAYTTEVIEFLIHERELGRPLLPESLSPDLCCCTIL